MDDNAHHIKFRVNGETVEVNVPGDVPRKTSLLTTLRDFLGLTGAKDGCSQRGECGACTVIVDGKAKKSCLIPIERVRDASVETIEGLARGENLHPLQWAVAEGGAVECGFCTPGAIMAGKALLDREIHPSRLDIKKALSGNLCRCGTYQQMIDAVQKASQALDRSEDAYRPIQWPEETDRAPVGRPYPRLDAEEKVTGAAVYGQDLKFGNMLFAVPVLTAHVHADILSVDIEPALKHPGVHAVLTANDIPGFPSRGVIVPDWPIFAKDRVRFTGEVIALVVGESMGQARRAAGMVNVAYRPLPLLSSPEEALSAGALAIHPRGNLCSREHVVRGDVERGLEEAHLVVDQTYRTACLEHAYIETEAGVATFSEEEGVVVHVGGHDSESNRVEIARALDLPEERVRIVRPSVGGSFGAKRDLSIQVFLALAAMKTGRPVKMVLTRSESMRMSTKRHPMRLHFVTGFSREGKITASRMHIVADAGAYSSESAVVLKMAVGHCTGPYDIPNLDVTGLAVFTNNVIGGPMRGYGFPQANFAMESQLDIAARRLGLGPIEIRRINAIKKGGHTAYGQLVETDVTLVECLERAYKQALASAPPQSEGWKVGIGLAGMWKNMGLSFKTDPGATADLETTPEGTILININCHELGQGTSTGLAQIAAQALGLPFFQLRIMTHDALSIPKGGPGIASRQTFVLGTAVLKAAQRLKEKVLDQAAKSLGVSKSTLRMTPHGVVDNNDPGRSLGWADMHRAAAQRGEPLRVSFYHELPTATDIPEAGNAFHDVRFDQILAYGAHAAVVRVEVSTGRILVDRLVAVHDVGRVINPLACRSQIVGGALMGLGQALCEELMLKDGEIQNDTLRSYRIPTNDLVEKIEAITVESLDAPSAHGAKGVSEPPAIPVAAAVANAICDAVGIRLTTLPLRLKSRS